MMDERQEKRKQRRPVGSDEVQEPPQWDGVKVPEVSHGLNRVSDVKPFSVKLRFEADDQNLQT